MRKALFFFFSLFTIHFSLFAQQSSISGKTTDKQDNSELIGVTILVKGTKYGAVTDENGAYKIQLPAGTFQIEVSYIGYEKLLYTGITIKEGEQKILNMQMNSSAVTLDQDIVIIGERPLIDVEESKSTSQISRDIIDAVPNRNVQGLLNTQTGVVLNPEGIHIRGGRTYQTGFYIDDVSASDPLAGTGFGIDIGSNAIDIIDVTTSAPGAEYGDASAGIVNTKTRTGGDHFALSFSAKRDNFGFNNDWNSTFNQQNYEAGFGGALKFRPLSNSTQRGEDSSPTKAHTPAKRGLHYFVSMKANFTDTYIQNPAEQVTSSLYPSTSWSPYEDNRWSGTLKLNYDFSSTKKISFTYLKSLTINQDYNMLRITSADVPFTPGYQFSFALQPDNANTYTHDTNLETVQWNHTPKPSMNYRVSLSRLFVHLRADANGRPWRPEEVNSEFDPASIVEFPTSYFNPDDSIVFVNPSPGLYNNDGIATLWHDHFVEEYTGKASATFYSKNTLNRFSVGTEYKHDQMQWIDIYRPWIGAPIQLPDSQFSQSFRLGDVSDVWKVSPVKGAVYVTDKYKFRGLIADVGLRFEYWQPGKYVDDAVANPDALIADEIRKSYLDHTVNLFGNRTKLRLLPKLAASFPIKENQVMYFNHGVSTVYPHPSYIYTGLDPFYSDRSTLGFIGNPDLNPEVDITYELGLKSQLGQNDALDISAYWKDEYDFITSSTILLEDATGREVSRTIRINSDYARVRGVEATYIKRAGKWFESSLSIAYSIATGQSSSASQSLQEILATGNSTVTKETPLAWDSPLDAKGYVLFSVNKEDGMFGKKWINKFNFYTEAIYRTGRRYTPYLLTGYEDYSGRPIYEVDPNPDHRNSELSVSSFWINATFKKWFEFKKTQLAISLEVTNLLNTHNTAIVNPVTGSAFEYGDDVPTEQRDPRYLDPRDPLSNNLPPNNPARYYEQRHV
ncbi:MAG: TonB-dependent receptor, partial [Chitinophagales bacterium]|nr:TonB-dependent receptor [Chitinophagales bacterium]